MMYLPHNYTKYPIWLTIDVEEVEDANFGITPKHPLQINYAAIINEWIVFCQKHNISSTAFVLGSFAKKYPHIIKTLHKYGHEIACHGLRHELVYNLPFDEWKRETQDAKKILEDTIGQEVIGYRAPSWSMPFEKKYYEALVASGFRFTSTYFPFKTYMYGNSIDKKSPFVITTPGGTITEIPLLKNIIPFSGGFYMRVLPFFLIQRLFANLINQGHKPIIYTHPYELLPHLFTRFRKDVKLDVAYFLTFFAVENSLQRFDKILKQFCKDKI
ncbi:MULTISPECIES: DUF3473 domain-containing protein [unclassified Nitratiruptor]|uniref:DUF3473 domain-containing protein n=1 Tax=unclassified Nitratiruptor TaxID=2624044 RepID=UPI0019159798|nr:MULTISPECIES: DUF3473 domain-containing protein [unclassified Nitratiruptor]